MGKGNFHNVHMTLVVKIGVIIENIDNIFVCSMHNASCILLNKYCNLLLMCK